MWATCMPHSNSMSCIISLSFQSFKIHVFPCCLKRSYIINTSCTLSFPHLYPSTTSFLSFPFLFLCFFFFSSFFFGLWIQLQVTHLTLSSSFGLKHRLFTNFARLVHILCSIWPYENGLIKEFKHKNQCPIYNASPTSLVKINSLETLI